MGDDQDTRGDGFVDTSVPIEDFESLDENIRAEVEREKKVGEYLVKAWKDRVTPLIIEEGNTLLDNWKQSLSNYGAFSYVSALASRICKMLLSGSNSESESEGFLYIGEKEVMRAEILATPGSLLEEDAERGHFLKGDGFVDLQPYELYHALREGCPRDASEVFALDFIADSLRREEIELPGLNLEKVTDGVLRVTVNYEL